MPEARLAGADDLAFVRDATLAAYSHYLPVLGAMPGPVHADHAAAIALGQVWLVRDGGADAGLMVLEAAADHLMIESLALLPGHQGRGLGRWMLGFAEDRARQAGAPELRLYANVLMTRNIGIYRQAGFAETHRKVVQLPQGVTFVRVYMAKPLM
ncbi:MAG TPA: GNAT family N-acetyltransferase [Acetobacteraceae bacterium]